MRFCKMGKKKVVKDAPQTAAPKAEAPVQSTPSTQSEETK